MHNRKIREAKAGDPDAALWLINEFRHSFRRTAGQPSSRADWGGFPSEREDQILDYLVECFDKIFDDTHEDRVVKGWDVAKALNVVEPSIRGPKPKRYRYLKLGLAVDALYKNRLKEAKSRPEAVLEDVLDDVAKSYGHPKETVRKGYKDFLKWNGPIL